MSNAPEQVWLDGTIADNTWQDSPEKCVSPHGPYTRADLARPKVKKLEWLSGGFDQDATFVDTTFTYQIQDGYFWYGAEVRGTACGTDEAAKAAAQADFERRIMECLE